MPGPGARMKFDELENIGSLPAVATVRFKAKGTKKCEIIITLGFETAARQVKDTQVAGGELQTHCDAAFAPPKDFLTAGTGSVIFRRKGSDGNSTMSMTLDADLDTKLPGTGGLIPLGPKKAAAKKKKAATKSKKR